MQVPLKLVMIGVPLAAVLLTASVFAVLSYRFADASLERSVAATLAAAATARRDAVVQRHDFWHRRAEAIAGDKAVEQWFRRVGRGSTEQDPPMLLQEAAAAHQQEVVAIVALDRRGRPLFKREQYGVDVTPWLDDIAFRRVRQVTDLGARETMFGSAAGVALPVGKGRVVGFIVVLFNMEGVFAVTRDYAGLGDTGETMIVRVEGGDVVRHITPPRFPRDAAPGGGKAEASALLDMVSSSDVGIFEDYRGEVSFAAARHVAGVDWIVVAKIDRDQAYGSLRRLLTAFGIAGLIVVAAIGVLAIALCMHALRQTRTLRHAATRLGQGDYAVEAPTGSVVEFNALARAFNRMRDGVLSALEGERAARKAANAASEAKSRFLATMSHEIRTPMNGVIGAADLLSRTSQDTSQRFLIETIVGSGEALLGLINDILDFSRLEAREVELSLAPFDPRETIDGVAAISARIADAKNLPVIVDIRSSAEGKRLGDEGRVRQILVNLVGNAVKFTRNGYVLVTAAATDAGALRVSVEDTGSGIPEDRLDAIFEAFEQVDNSMTREFEGTGLGLAISRRLARAMGGDITVTSTLDEGSRFTLELPVPRAMAERPDSPTGLDGIRVAVLDPIAPAAAALSRLLRAAGARVLKPHAFEGADAVIVSSLSSLEAARAQADGAAIILHGRVGEDESAALRDGRLFEALPRPAPARRIVEAVLRTRREPVAAEETQDTPAEHQPLAGLQVLVAEDNAVNRTIVDQMLAQNGASVTLCADGAEALEAVKTMRPDLALLDVSMPVMDGLEVLAQIRALDDARAKTPVIMLTAHVNDEIRQAADAADGYLIKPVNESTLIESVVAVVTRSRGGRVHAA
ncbi:MAG: ATP-binding protein [Pseudomonadota bacterium]